MNPISPYKLNSFTILVISIYLITILNGCNSDSTKATHTSNSTLSRLNDTGITLYTQNFPMRLETDPKPIALTLTPDTSAPGQDADTGSDTNSDNSNNDGIGGFQFTKLDSNGKALENQANHYSTEQWQCVKDEITGLTWEIKTLSGLQQNAHRYTWYEPNENINGGHAGEIGDNTICDELTNCNTNAYIAAINALNSGKGLCGINSWRLPLREELRSLIDYSVIDGPMIDTNFFPNTEATDTWTSQTSYYRSNDGISAWEVHFNKGYSEEHKKSANDVTVRLVH